MAAKNKTGQDEKVALCRIHRIDDAIRSGRFPNAESLSKELEVSVRTISRDFGTLRDMYDAPLEYDPVHRGFCYTEPNFFIKYVPLRQKRTIRFDYEPLQKTTYMQREIDPYHVVYQRGNWYVAGAHCQNT